FGGKISRFAQNTGNNFPLVSYCYCNYLTRQADNSNNRAFHIEFNGILSTTGRGERSCCS
ncbi:MAG: hypothetical protein M3Z01_05680, partial [Thermoproteota archaeon]|nr:hypothetical protein [Thermoproteota archaeon]